MHLNRSEQELDTMTHIRFANYLADLNAELHYQQTGEYVPPEPAPANNSEELAKLGITMIRKKRPGSKAA